MGDGRIASVECCGSNAIPAAAGEASPEGRVASSGGRLGLEADGNWGISYLREYAFEFI
jgi:hypothetical protein